MTIAEQTAILQAIREDNVSLFHSLAGKRKAMRFGRFPILSICYLYHSRKIVAAYRDAMRAEPFDLPELPEVYNRFVQVCGRALRLWAGYVHHEVHPLMMLAILGDWRTLRSQYPTYVLTEEEQTRILDAISLRYGVQATIDANGALTLPPKPLTRGAVRYLTGASITVVVVMMVAAAMLTVGILFRQGIPVNTADALRHAEAAKTYRLTRDLSLEGGQNWADFTLDGDGHTITLYVSDTPMLDSFGGTVRNCRIRLTGETVAVRRTYACLCLDNRGTFDKVDFVFDEGLSFALEGFDRTEGEAPVSCGFGGLFVANGGTVRDCTLSGTVRWSGQAEVDGQVGLVAAYNTGTIEHVTMQATLATNTVDSGGLVFRNEADGVVRSCTLTETATVTQTTSVFAWSPMVGGVCAFNYGTVEYTTMLGAVTAAKIDVERPDTVTNLSVVYAGGIAAHNYGTVYHNAMVGTVSGEGDDLSATFVGGIAADNSIEEDESAGPVWGTLDANIVEGEVGGVGYRIFLGGVAGIATGHLYRNCFHGALSIGNGAAQTAVGSLVGYGQFADADIPDLFADNHVLQLYLSGAFGFTTALPVVGYYEPAKEGLATMTGVSAHGSLDFDTMEVYWYGKEGN